MDALRMARWVAPALLATGMCVAAFLPNRAQAQESDALVRVVVDVADVVIRGGYPYYRHGHYRDADRLVVVRDRYGRPVYYRVVDRRDGYYRDRYRYRQPVYAYDDYPEVMTARRVKCNKQGACKVSYYDPRFDRRGNRDGYRGDRDGRRGGHRGHDDD